MDRIINFGLYVYTVFSCSSISGIEISNSIAFLGLVYLFVKSRNIVFFNDRETKNIFIFFCFFIVWGIFISFFSSNSKISLRKLFEITSSIIIYFSVINLQKNKIKTINRLIFIFFLFLTFQSIYGIIQYFTGLDFIHKTKLPQFSRIRGTLGYCNSLGGVLGMAIPLIFSFVIYSFKFKLSKSVFYFFSLVSSIAALIFTLTRGAWIGATLGILFISFYMFRWRSLLILLLLPVMLIIPPVKNRIKNTIRNNDANRLIIWRISIDMIKNSPIFGYGFDNFQKQFYEKLEEGPNKFVKDIEQGHFHTHNIFLNSTIESGIVGLIILLIILFFVFKLLFYKVKNSNLNSVEGTVILGITGSIIDFVFHGMFDNIMRGETLFLFWFLLGTVAAIKIKD